MTIFPTHCPSVRLPVCPSLALVAAALAAPPALAAQARDTTLSLTSRVFDNTRTIRILLPPGYHDPANAARRYPVFYFTDGVAAWHGWGVPEVAQQLWDEGAIPHYIFVGIDNGGSTIESTEPARDRAEEYLPYPDPSWTESPPEPRGQLFPAFLFDEVMPLVAESFRVDPDPGLTGLAGDSFAGAITLYTGIKYPHRLGMLLIESPSLHVGNGQLIDDAAHAGSWPSAIYLGVGTAEGDTPETQQRMVSLVRELAEVLGARTAGSRVGLLEVEGGTHWYDSWKERLPRALLFLLAEVSLEGSN